MAKSTNFSIASWNINSVRLRENLVLQFLKTHKPDMLCLQEIKCMNDQFPAKNFKKLGYTHQAVHGQKGYHGVAILSRLPFHQTWSTDYCKMGDTRHICAEIDLGPKNKRAKVHNFYVPAGGDEPDREANPKFDHKLRFIAEMEKLQASEDGVPAILVGDLNIAPLETDVWSHKQLLKVVSHTPIETEGLNRIMQKGNWTDVVRQHFGAEQKLYSWWSYRARDWQASDRGRRLDHIWAAPEIAQKLVDVEILRQARGWEKASDHVPIIARFSV